MTKSTYSYKNWEMVESETNDAMKIIRIQLTDKEKGLILDTQLIENGSQNIGFRQYTCPNMLLKYTMYKRTVWVAFMQNPDPGQLMVLNNISKICSINSHHIGLHIYIYILILSP